MINLLFCAFVECSSLRGVSGAMLDLLGKTQHFKLDHIPYRSTLPDANKRRITDFFADVYRYLLKKFQHLILDSRIKKGYQ